MGEIADLIINGALCELCGGFVGDEVGYSRLCPSCAKEDEAGKANCTSKDGRPIYRPGKTNCPECNKLVSCIGLDQHVKDAHYNDKEV